MRALLQRVRSCAVNINGQQTAAIDHGMCIFLGVRTGDSDEDATGLAGRCAALRIFDDDAGKMNRSVREVDGSVMVVSQFTLYGDTRKGNRPSYTDAAPPAEAEQLYECFVAALREILGAGKVRTGIFRAMMQVELVNDGPVTVMIESKNSRLSTGPD